MAQFLRILKLAEELKAIIEGRDEATLVYQTIPKKLRQVRQSSLLSTVPILTSSKITQKRAQKSVIRSATQLTQVEKVMTAL